MPCGTTRYSQHVAFQRGAAHTSAYERYRERQGETARMGSRQRMAPRRRAKQRRFWARYQSASRFTRFGIGVGVLALVALVCLTGLAFAGHIAAERSTANGPAAGSTPSQTSTAQPTATPTFAQEALIVAQSSGAAGSVSVSVQGTAITVHDAVGDQPDLTSARTLVFAEAFAIQRGLWESLMHPSSVTVIITAPTLAGVAQSAPLGSCTLTAQRETTILWSAETPLDAWAYAYDKAALTDPLQVSHT